MPGRGRHDLARDGAQRFELLGGHGAGDLPDGGHLDEGTDLRVLVQVPLGHLGDPEALVPYGLDQPLAREREHRLAYGGGGDAQLGGEDGRGVDGPDAELPGDHRGAQGVRHLVAQPLLDEDRTALPQIAHSGPSVLGSAR